LSILKVASTTDLSGLRAVIVDGNEVNRRVVHQQISAREMRNGSYASAKEALVALAQALDAGDPHPFVIADYRMPGMESRPIQFKISPLNVFKLFVIRSVSTFTSAYRSVCESLE